MNPKITLNPPDRLYGLDHLRTLAITLVFLFHYKILVGGFPDGMADLIQFGWTGVDLFFVLSGFLIASQLFAILQKGQKINLKTFFLKRFFRIMPLFGVVLGIYFCFPAFREKEALPPLWKFLTFTQNLGLNLKDYGTFSHAWSLCVEEHFYLIFPIILISLQGTRFFKKSYWLLIGLGLLGFALRMYYWNQYYLPYIEADFAVIEWYKYVYYPTYNRLDGLLVGVSIAGIYQFSPNLWSKIAPLGNYFLVISLIILATAYVLCADAQSYQASVFGFPLVALGYGLMVMSAISYNSFLYKWQSKGTTLIATLSYALYLTHKGIIHLTQLVCTHFNKGMSSHWILLISIFFCILVAWLLHWAIEKPFLKLRNVILKTS
jgi:peptidoglycan/LPS O-acetylase OafA/YrhL